jgi:GNAT superfamily N-acetyltransferase
MCKLQKIGLFNIVGQSKVNNILFECGKDMAQKYDLHHWDNSHLKNFIIVLLCELKNSVYLVVDENTAVATFQTKIEGNVLKFEKLATLPSASGKGIGSYCMNSIENLAKDAGCTKVCMEVYSPSQHAIDFYKHRGYTACGETKTLKYSEIKMEKKLG